MSESINPVLQKDYLSAQHAIEEATVARKIGYGSLGFHAVGTAAGMIIPNAELIAGALSGVVASAGIVYLSHRFGAQSQQKRDDIQALSWYEPTFQPEE